MMLHCFLGHFFRLFRVFSVISGVRQTKQLRHAIYSRRYITYIGYEMYCQKLALRVKRNEMERIKIRNIYVYDLGSHQIKMFKLNPTVFGWAKKNSRKDIHNGRHLVKKWRFSRLQNQVSCLNRRVFESFYP